jgi:hypothetical protein
MLPCSSEYVFIPVTKQDYTPTFNIYKTIIIIIIIQCPFYFNVLTQQLQEPITESAQED